MLAFLKNAESLWTGVGGFFIFFSAWFPIVALLVLPKFFTRRPLPGKVHLAGWLYGKAPAIWVATCLLGACMRYLPLIAAVPLVLLTPGIAITLSFLPFLEVKNLPTYRAQLRRQLTVCVLCSVLGLHLFLELAVAHAWRESALVFMVVIPAVCVAIAILTISAAIKIATHAPPALPSTP